MIIRCERCSTLYELDETLLAPAGSQVQCTRCDHVFTACPPVGDSAEPSPAARVAISAAELETAGAPFDPPARDLDRPAPSLDRPTPAPSLARSTPAPRSEATGPRAPAHDARHARGGEPSVYRRTPSPSTVRAHPVLRRDTVGAFESRLRWSARLRWLVPAVALGLGVLGAGAFFLLRGRVDPGAARSRAEGLALLALDDAESLDRAVSRLDDAIRRAPRLRAAVADRALALVMQATALGERSRALAATRGARQAERERLLREQPPGWEDAERAAAGSALALEAEGRALDERARALVASAREALSPIQAELRDDSSLVRALAAAQAAAGERDAALALARTAGSPGERDPWIELVDAALDAADPQRALQERALVKLAAIAARNPELLRARLLLARTQAAIGRTDDARGTLDRLLAANPRHEGARALREELSPRPPAASPAESPPGNAALLPRKPITHRSPAVTPPEAIPPVAGEGMGARPPATAGGPAAPAAAPSGSAPATARGSAPTALTPASIPEVAPASGMPQIAPPEAPEAARRPSREPAVFHEETIGGG